MEMLLVSALDRELEHPALLTRGDQLITGGATERREVFHRPRIGGVYLQQFTYLHTLQRFLGFEYWQRAIETFRIE